MACGLLLFACPKRSRQEKGHPRRRALRASCAPGPRAGPGLRGGTSVCHLSGRRDPSRRSPGVARGRVRARSPRLMGPRQAAAIPGRRSASVRRSAQSSNIDPVCRAGRMPALFWGPRTARRGADGSVAGHRPAIAAMDRGDRSDGPWMAHRGGPAVARVPGGQDARRARRWGVLLFGYFLLDKQEKVTRGPGMARGKGQGRRLKRERRSNLAVTTRSDSAREAAFEAGRCGGLTRGCNRALRFAAINGEVDPEPGMARGKDQRRGRVLGWGYWTARRRARRAGAAWAVAMNSRTWG
jgi:hypothetical protein